MKRIVSVLLITAMLFSLTLAVSADNASGDSLAAAKAVAEEYIKDGDISAISVLPAAEQKNQLTLDSKYYISIAFNYTEDLKPVEEYITSPEMYTFVVLDDNRPATIINVEKQENGSYSISKAGGDPEICEKTYSEFANIADDSNVLMIDGGYRRFMYGNVDGKAMVMPLSAFDMKTEFPEYYNEEKDAVLFPAEKYNEVKRYIYDKAMSYEETGMGGSIFSHLDQMEAEKASQRNSIILTICISAGAVIIIAAAGVIIYKKRKISKAKEE